MYYVQMQKNMLYNICNTNSDSWKYKVEELCFMDLERLLHLCKHIFNKKQLPHNANNHFKLLHFYELRKNFHKLAINFCT